MSKSLTRILATIACWLAFGLSIPIFLLVRMALGMSAGSSNLSVGEVLFIGFCPAIVVALQAWLYVKNDRTFGGSASNVFLTVAATLQLAFVGYVALAG